jgi:hypothetical protein
VKLRTPRAKSERTLAPKVSMGKLPTMKLGATYNGLSTACCLLQSAAHNFCGGGSVRFGGASRSVDSVDKVKRRLHQHHIPEGRPPNLLRSS